jgi:GT2 family glycosyltransferase
MTEDFDNTTGGPSMAIAHRVNICIAVKNNLEYTKKCLESILSDPTKIDFVVSIIDDGSTDDTPRYLKNLAKKNKKINLLKEDRIPTLSGRWNALAGSVVCEYIITLNNDTTVPHGWLDRIIKVFQDNSDSIAMLAPCVTNSRMPVNVMEDLPQEPQVLRLEKFGTYPSGICYAIKSEAFHKVKGFNTEYDLSGEDADFCFKLWDAGYEIAIDEAVLIWHAGGATTGELPDKESIWKRNGTLFLKKWEHKLGPVVDEQSDSLIDKLVSIICICHYDPKNLDHTFMAIRSQTHHNFECIVLDCYGNVSGDIAALIGNDPRFKIVTGKNDGTYAEAVKLGVESINGKSSYVCFVHEGDMISPHAVRGMINSMSDECAIAYSGVRRVNDNLEQVGPVVMNSEFSHVRMIVSPTITPLTIYSVKALVPFVKSWTPRFSVIPFHEINTALAENAVVKFVNRCYYDHLQLPYSITNYFGVEYAYEIKKNGEEVIKKRGMVDQGYYISSKVEANLSLAKREKLTCGHIKERNDVEKWKAARTDKYREANWLLYRRNIYNARNSCKNLLIIGDKPDKIEINAEYIFVADIVKHESGAAMFKTTDFSYIPFANQKFDMIICTDVLQYIASPDMLLAAMLDALTNDGELFIKVSQDCGVNDICHPPLRPINFWRNSEEFKSFLMSYSPVCAEAGGVYKLKRPIIRSGLGKVTAIVLSYNRERYIARCLDSILNQTYKDLIVKVFDDGSDDGTCKIVYDYIKRGHPVELHDSNHIGVAQNFRRAYDSADTEFVCGIDSDDWIAPSSFECTLDMLKADPETGVIFSDYIITESDGKLVHIGDRSRMQFSKDSILDFFMSFQFRMVRTSAYKKLDKSDFPLPDAPVGPDYDFSVRLSEVTNFKHIPMPLYYYRQHGGTINSTKKQLQVDSSHAIIRAARRRRGQLPVG